MPNNKKTNSSKEKSVTIPLVTDVVVLGNPEMKRLAQEKLVANNHAVINFQQRIDEVESAIGQDESKSPSRAHAIRSEYLTL